VSARRYAGDTRTCPPAPATECVRGALGDLRAARTRVQRLRHVVCGERLALCGRQAHVSARPHHGVCAGRQAHVSARPHHRVCAGMALCGRHAHVSAVELHRRCSRCSRQMVRSLSPVRANEVPHDTKQSHRININFFENQGQQ